MMTQEPPVIPFELEPSWRHKLRSELAKPYIAQLAAFVAGERLGSEPVYPPEDLVFNAFRLTSFDRVRVAIVGQDPYHGPGQAHGLSFSVPHGISLPPSLKNIFKELATDLNVPAPKHGCLLSWARQGVLLLNASLTVRHKEPMSHHGRGWEQLTDAALEALSEREEPVIFVLWGRSAQEKAAHLHLSGAHGQHVILKAAHPSPFSANKGFFGCKHFSQINKHLESWGHSPIDWSLL